MAARVQFHVVCRKADRQWTVKRNGRVVATAAKKGEAVSIARKLAMAEKLASVRIHNRSGMIAREYTYPKSSDPYPPKG